MVSAPLLLGTRSWRLPSFFCMSSASPRLMWAGVIWVGLPSITSKPTFSSGIDLRALTSAKPIRWVNETLPPRARERWLLMTIRLSQSSLTGTERTEVAVGTLSESSMLATVRAGARRSTVYVGWSAAPEGAGAAFSLGTGRSVPLAGSAALVWGRGVALGAGVRAVFAAGAGVGASSCSVCPVGSVGGAGVAFVTAGASAVAAAADAGAAPLAPLPPALPVPFFLRYATQVSATLQESRVNCSYSSSTSHSLAPKSEEGSGWEVGSELVCCCGTGAFASSGTCAWVSGSDSRLVPHARKYRSTVPGWCMVYPIGMDGRGRAPRGPPEAPPGPDGKERGLPPLDPHPSTSPGAHTDLPVTGPVTRPARRRVRRAGAAALAAAAALAVGGCGGDSSTPSAPPTTGSSSGAPEVATVVSIDKVAGTGKTSYRQRFHAHAKTLSHDVGEAVDAWFDGGFLGVDYPTSDYPDAFRSFTAQAQQDAVGQKVLMTTGPLGERIDGVTTLKRSVDLDVLAPQGRPAGVTARFVLRFATTGQVTKKVTVTGRLFLTQVAGGPWRIFGYDVAKGAK